MTIAKDDPDPGSQIDPYEPGDWGSPYGAPILDAAIEAAFLEWITTATSPTVRAAFNAGYTAGRRYQ